MLAHVAVERSDEVVGRRTIRPGLCSVTLRHLGIDAVIGAAVDAGLEGIEWGADVHVPPDDRAGAADVGARSRATGLACPSYGSYLRAGSSQPQEVDDVLAAAEALGASTVRVWCDWLSAADADADRRSAMARDLAVWCDRAAARDLDLALELHAWTLTETASSTQALLAEVDRDNLFTYWQPMDGDAPERSRSELGVVIDDLANLHVFRWDADGRRLPLDDGTDLWPDILSAAARPTGRWPSERWAFLEFVRDDDVAQLLDDAAVLRSWLSGISTD
jgi:sugar phosphate isomerase/epimerase